MHVLGWKGGVKMKTHTKPGYYETRMFWPIVVHAHRANGPLKWLIKCFAVRTRHANESGLVKFDRFSYIGNQFNSRLYVRVTLQQLSSFKPLSVPCPRGRAKTIAGQIEKFLRFSRMCRRFQTVIGIRKRTTQPKHVCTLWTREQGNTRLPFARTRKNVELQIIDDLSKLLAKH